MFTCCLSILALVATLASVAGGDAVGNAHALPSGARVRLGTVGFQILRGLYYADLKEDGQTIVHLDASDHLCFTNVNTGTTTRSQRLQPGFQARLVLAPRGQRFATIEQNQVVVRDLASGKPLHFIPYKPASRGQHWAPVSFSADGKCIAVAWGRQNQTIYRVWNLERKQTGQEIVSPMTDWAFLTLSPDGQQLVTWGHWNKHGVTDPTVKPDDCERTITVWDAVTGKPIRQLQVADLASRRRICYSPDGKTLAVTGPVIELWNTVTWQQRCRVAGRLGRWPVGNAAAFSPDGKHLGILYADGSVDLRNGSTGERRALISGHAPGWSLRFTDNHRAVVVGGVEMVFRAWEIPSGKLLTPHHGHLSGVRQVTFTPDGKHLLSLAEDGEFIRWDVAAQRPVAGGGLTPTNYPAWVQPGELLEQVSPDGCRGVFGKPFSGGVRVVDLGTGKEIFAVARKLDMTYTPNVSCSPGGTRLLLNPGLRYGYPDDARFTPVWDSRTGQKLLEVPLQDNRAIQTFFSPDDRFLVVLAGTYDRQSKKEGLAGQVWDTETRKRLAGFAVQGRGGHFAAGVSPDGRTLAVTSLGRQVTILDFPSARPRMEAVPTSGTPASPVVFSPDGYLFALGLVESTPGTGDIQVWETASGTIRHQLHGHRSGSQRLAFSPAARLLASGSRDSTVVLWNLDALNCGANLRNATPELLWERLGEREAAQAYPVLQALVARPAEAVAFLGQKLVPAVLVTMTPGEIKHLIRQLDAASFRVRERATNQLMDLGREVELFLREARAANPSLEARQRLEKLLETVTAPAVSEKRLRDARAVEVLERIGTAAARGVLERLATGQPGHPLTEEAKAAAKRLATRP